MAKKINHYTLMHSEHLVFLSHHVHQFLKKRIGFSADATVIPHGFLQVQGVMPIERNLPERLTLLFLGRVCQYKGVDMFLDSLQYLNAERINQCVIAGQLTQDQKPLKDRQTPIPVQWVDKWLSEEEMAHYLQRADILVLPYREATQSGVVTLGISSGLPMVMTRVGGLVEQCNEEESIFVEPNAKSLALGLNELSTNSEKYLQLQKKLEHKRKNGSWSALASDLLDCINRE